MDKNIDIVLQDVTVKYKVAGDAINSLKGHVINRIKNGKKDKIFCALNNVSVSIGSGEIFGIVGRNGAGKSTLLKVISRVIVPTNGRVIVRGVVYPLLQVGAGFHPELTGMENIYLNGTLLGHTRREIDQKLSEITEFANIGRFINSPVRTYSSGMQARLGFSIASAWKPDVLILDEVLAVGDIKFQKKCLKRINKFQLNGTTTIIVSHSPERIASMCNRAMWLERGIIKEIDDAKKITDNYKRTLI